MDTTQTIILTILAVGGVIALGSLIYRLSEFDDHLWIEPLVIANLMLFAYLVAK